MNKRISGVDAYLKTTIQLLSAGIIMIPYLFVTGGFGSALTEGSLSATTVVLLLFVGIVHTGIAYVLYFGAIGGLKAQAVALLSYIDPIFAVVLSALVLGESMDALGWIGAAVVIGAMMISEIPEKNK